MARNKKKIIINIIDSINLIILINILFYHQFKVADLPTYKEIIFITLASIGLILKLSEWKHNSTIDNIGFTVVAIFVIGTLLFAMLGII